MEYVILYNENDLLRKKKIKRKFRDKINYNCFNVYPCLLYTSDAADERSSVDLGGRRIIKKKKN